jgi:recombinational DNA repair protein (RecF pathway)
LKMGYALAFSACATCNRTFGYNPHRVPSIRIEGVREPVCRTCIERANPLRKAKGLEEFKIHPDAYEPIEESEL